MILSIFISDVIGVVVSCAPIQFLFNEETNFKDLAFLSFKIEDDRYIHYHCVLLSLILLKNMIYCSVIICLLYIGNVESNAKQWVTLPFSLRKIVFFVNNLEFLKYAYYDFGILINSQLVLFCSTSFG